MGRIKSYYHDQIVEELEEPGPDYDPEEEYERAMDKRAEEIMEAEWLETTSKDKDTERT